MVELDALFVDLISGNEARAERAALRLGAIGNATLPGLEPLLKHADPDIRWWAVRTLGEMADPVIEPLLKRALADDAAAVQSCAARALITSPFASLIPDLVGCLEAGDSLLTRLAGTALAAAGAAAVPALIDVMESGSQRARLEAVKALAEIKDPRAIPVFFNAVQEGDSPLVEYWAEIGLDRLGIGMTFFKP